MYFPGRTYQAMLACARTRLSGGDFRSLKNACQSPPNPKGDDAWRLLAAMEIVSQEPAGKSECQQKENRI
jgi:hypothetical protein